MGTRLVVKRFLDDCRYTSSEYTTKNIFAHCPHHGGVFGPNYRRQIGKLVYWMLASHNVPFITKLSVNLVLTRCEFPFREQGLDSIGINLIILQYTGE